MTGKNAGMVKMFVGLPCTTSGYRYSALPSSSSSAVAVPINPQHNTM